MHVWRVKDGDGLSDEFVIEISHQLETLRAEIPIHYILEHILLHYQIRGKRQAKSVTDCRANSIYLGFLHPAPWLCHVW